MDATLTWLLLIVAAVFLIVGAMRFDLLRITWRDAADGTPRPPHNAPPTPRWRAASGFQPHDAPLQKPAFHRSGRRH